MTEGTIDRDVVEAELALAQKRVDAIDAATNRLLAVSDFVDGFAVGNALRRLESAQTDLEVEIAGAMVRLGQRVPPELAARLDENVREGEPS